ncbi:MAG: hypothetical protein OXG67_01715 [bacterium]|nr:hypothetical protein [bacterium]
MAKPDPGSVSPTWRPWTRSRRRGGPGLDPRSCGRSRLDQPGENAVVALDSIPVAWWQSAL